MICSILLETNCFKCYNLGFTTILKKTVETQFVLFALFSDIQFPSIFQHCIALHATSKPHHMLSYNRHWYGDRKCQMSQVSWPGLLVDRFGRRGYSCIKVRSYYTAIVLRCRCINYISATKSRQPHHVSSLNELISCDTTKYCSIESHGCAMWPRKAIAVYFERTFTF